MLCTWSLAASRQVLRTQYQSVLGLSTQQNPKQGSLSFFLQPQLSANYYDEKV